MILLPCPGGGPRDPCEFGHAAGAPARPAPATPPPDERRRSPCAEANTHVWVRDCWVVEGAGGRGAGGGGGGGPRRPPAGVGRHGGEFPEHLAIAAIRRQGSEPARWPVPPCGLLLQDVHAAALPVAGLRERAQ